MSSAIHVDHTPLVASPTAPPVRAVSSALQTAAAWTLTIPEHLATRLLSHLFPGDGDEHGAVLLAGVSLEPTGPRLLVRDVVLACDGVDYVPGQRGYRMLTGAFVTRTAVRCRDERLVYLAAHNHRGRDHVAFSDDDLTSQARGYPALLDVVDGMPVGALVFAERAVAGRLWVRADRQVSLREARILGPCITRLTPAPAPLPPGRAPAYDRQARLFGDRGQDLLAQVTVGVIGAGGIGSLIVELLARLGVGCFIIVDPDRIEETNVPRITGATRWDAMTWLTHEGRSAWMRRLGARIATSKVSHMRRLIRKANPRAQVTVLEADFVQDAVARRFRGCDYLFLAADTMRARLVFNALVHAYLIPGVQVGAKVPVEPVTGEVGDVFATARRVTPSWGCLWCNGLITADGLQREAETTAERPAQRYVDDPDVKAASVITLNALAAAQATNDFLFALTDLTLDEAHPGYVTFHPRRRAVTRTNPRQDTTCPHCGDGRSSEFARGDAADLPTSLGSASSPR